MRSAAARVLSPRRRSDNPGRADQELVVGPALYRDALERPFGDVGVLVRRRDFRRVVGLARRERFELVHDSKQLGCVNVVVPPGIGVDVRCSIGPPFLTSESADVVFGRAKRIYDPRICDAPIQWLNPHDHLLVLVVDALMDKLALSAARRLVDLQRGLALWMRSPSEFAEHARRAGVAVASSLVFGWVHRETEDPLAAAVVAALAPLPKVPAAVAELLSSRLLPRSSNGPMARVAVRLVADRSRNGFLALAAGAVGRCSSRFATGGRIRGARAALGGACRAQRMRCPTGLQQISALFAAGIRTIAEGLCGPAKPSRRRPSFSSVRSRGETR